MNLPLLAALVLVVLSIINIDRSILRPKQVSIACDKVINGGFSGEIREYYDNGQILTWARVRMGTIQGHASVWRKNGELESDRMYFSKGKWVYVKKWHKNGQLAESYMARKVMDLRKMQAVFFPHGQYKAWYANGQLKHSASYGKGKLKAQTKRTIVRKIPFGFWKKDGTKLMNSSIPKTLPSIPVVPRIWYELGAREIMCGKSRKRSRKL